MASVSDLGDLDPDDPRPASQQIANHLRAAILTRRLKPGDRLPTQVELAQRYDVARETVKAALRTLSNDRLIVSRQGSGVYVRSQTERPVGLRPHIEAAFEAQSVTVDFAGFSGETLHGALQEPLDKIRAGRLTPRTIAVRILLPDFSAQAALPVAVDGDNDAVQQRARRIVQRQVDAISDQVQELAEMGLVESATVDIRAHRGTPAFKLYVLNGTEAFFGFYPVVEHGVTISGTPMPIYDVLGKDTVLFHFALDEDADTAVGPRFLEQALQWFETTWATVAMEHSG